jgi:hypothetical protein
MVDDLMLLSEVCRPSSQWLPSIGATVVKACRSCRGASDPRSMIGSYLLIIIINMNILRIENFLASPLEGLV